MADNTNSNEDKHDVFFGIIPFWVIESIRTSTAMHLYCVLTLWMDFKTHDGWPSRAQLAEALGKGVKTVDRAMRELEDIGAVQVTRRRRKGTKENYSNTYFMPRTPPDYSRPQMPEEIELDYDPDEEEATIEIDWGTELTPRSPANVAVTRPTYQYPSVSRPTSSSAPVAPSPQAATAREPEQEATAESRLSPLQELGDEDLKNKLLDMIVRASADWQHYTYVDIPNDLFDCPDSIGVLEESINNLYDDVDRIVGDDICNKGWDDRLARLIAQKPDRPRWGAAVWLNTYINWARLQG